MNRVLVVGVPRSGTSWVGRVLGSTPGAAYLGEPDNHEHAPFGLRAKVGVPGYFYPSPSGRAPDYERLWQAAFAEAPWRAELQLGLTTRLRRKLAVRLLHSASDADLLAAFRSPRRQSAALRWSSKLAVPERITVSPESIVVKSVHAQLALEWITDRFPVHVVIVLRHPLNVVSSWLQLGWLRDDASDPLAELEPRVASEVAVRLGVPQVDPEGSRLSRATWLICLLTTALRTAHVRHPDWMAVSHEALCEKPHELLSTLAAGVGLRWNAEVSELLDRLDRPGTGYATTRERAGLSDAWKSRLTPEQAEEASRVLALFGVSDWTGIQSAP